jgi:hypothetical protein
MLTKITLRGEYGSQIADLTLQPLPRNCRPPLFSEDAEYGQNLDPVCVEGL